jgi:hypothetical protein
MEELIELEIEMGTFPNTSIKPVLPLCHILEGIRDILCPTGMMTI